MRILFFSSLCIILCILCEYVLSDVTPVHISQLSVLVFHRDSFTTSRKAAYYPQIELIGGNAANDASIPDQITCENIGYDGISVAWQCTTEMPVQFKLSRTDVVCEGWTQPGDSYIVPGSCSVQITIDYSGKSQSTKPSIIVEETTFEPTVDVEEELYNTKHSHRASNDIDDDSSTNSLVITIIGIVFVFFLLSKLPNNNNNNNNSSPVKPTQRPDLPRHQPDPSSRHPDDLAKEELRRQKKAEQERLFRERQRETALHVSPAPSTPEASSAADKLRLQKQASLEKERLERQRELKKKSRDTSTSIDDTPEETHSTTGYGVTRTR
ncbi:Store-operated calcium entry-associated regulatory factor like protein [Aduncisulcus paluster]|uniref:Store-operated calcium entry-associated regulatory factor n=1 Tax=Aduncisulcus paluster TaxID=2918883 RepID=A0ABQ5L213_9EUKA|nr:Store-operated calcium entry-associated regulatory factor like protein [Aduncisulcus paluster]